MTRRGGAWGNARRLMWVGRAWGSWSRRQPLPGQRGGWGGGGRGKAGTEQRKRTRRALASCSRYPNPEERGATWLLSLALVALMAIYVQCTAQPPPAHSIISYGARPVSPTPVSSSLSPFPFLSLPSASSMARRCAVFQPPRSSSRRNLSMPALPKPSASKHLWYCRNSSRLTPGRCVSRKAFKDQGAPGEEPAGKGACSPPEEAGAAAPPAPCRG